MSVRIKWPRSLGLGFWWPGGFWHYTGKQEQQQTTQNPPLVFQRFGSLRIAGNGLWNDILGSVVPKDVDVCEGVEKQQF